MNFHLKLDMKPVAKGRPRMTRSGHTYTPAKTREAEKLIREAASYIATTPMQGPLSMSVLLTFKKPKSNKSEYHIQRPDADNGFKLVSDALNGIAYNDDSQIVTMMCRKEWGDKSSVEVWIDPV